MKFFASAMTSSIALALAACGQGPAKDNMTSEQSGPPASADAASLTPSEQLLAAAEPFEKLTEIAFTAPLTEIDATIVDARRSADSVGSLLTPTAKSGADKLFGDIDRARKSEDRAGLALASIEIYRGIVSSVPPGTKVPAAVSLLDYAGFRYQADLKSSPVRWADMAEAMRFARAQWADLKPSIKDASLAASFDKALGAMEKAAAGKDAAAAAAAATGELNLVDKLETYFTGPVAAAP